MTTTTKQCADMTDDEIDSAVDRNLPWSRYKPANYGGFILMRGFPPSEPGGYYAVSCTWVASKP